MNIFGRYGGLTLIRRAGEYIVMRWPHHDVQFTTIDVGESSATVRVGHETFDMNIGESIEVPGPDDDKPANCIITLDDIAAERAAIRIVAPRRVSIIRGEKLQ